jgi:hypothetical protein
LRSLASPPFLLHYLEHFSAANILPEWRFSMHGNGNPNWQDKLLGGTILAGFVVVAIVTGLFSLATWSGDGLRDHAFTQPGQSNSATN